MRAALFAPTLALTGAVLYLRRRLPRKAPAFSSWDFSVIAADGVKISGRHAAHDRPHLIVLAHPAVIGQDYAPLAELAELLYPDFDIATFDFRGHGKSAGYLTPDLRGPAADLAAVLDHFRTSGYGWTGVVGFSLGGMAGICHAASRHDLDALASIGAPPHMPDTGALSRHPRLVPLFLRALGLHMRSGQPAPEEVIDLVGMVAPTPLLLVHGSGEIFYPREDFEALWERAGEPKTRLVLQAGHAETGSQAHLIVQWLRRSAGLA